MSVNWNEVRGRANKFVNRWKVAVSESSDSQSFWVEFFGIFEIDFVEDDSLMFEKAVPKSDGHIGHWETRRLGVENLWMLNKKKDVAVVFDDIKNAGLLDLVAAW